MIHFLLNDQLIETTESGGTILLDFIRYHQSLRGTKIGCREGDCGTCTVLVGTLKEGNIQYRSATSCLMPLQNAHLRHIITIEGLNMDQLSPVQQAIVEEGGTQCGFCTIGFVLSLSGHCMQQQPSSLQAIIASMDGNICRCTGYKSLERAAARIHAGLQSKDHRATLSWLVENRYLPPYFNEAPKRLHELKNQHQPIPPQEAAPLVGGGTDLYVQQPEHLEQQNIRTTEREGQAVWEQNGQCIINASATVTDIQQSSVMQAIFPRLVQHMKLISSTPIRNMATLAGNLVNASPIGDLTIFFLAMGSQLLLQKGANKRKLALDHFYKSYKNTDLRSNELVTALRFELLASNEQFNFEKVSKRTHLDIASVNSACRIKAEGGQIETVRLSAGGVGPIPMLLTATADFLTGKTISAPIITQANKVMQAEISPISDARGSADYKRLLLRQLLWAHMLRFFPHQLRLAELVTEQ